MIVMQISIFTWEFIYFLAKDNCIDDEVDEDELPDKEKYSDQLEPIGYLASLILGHSLPILTRCGAINYHERIVVCGSVSLVTPVNTCL